MFGVPRPMTGDPASEMEAFVDTGLKSVDKAMKGAKGKELSVLSAPQKAQVEGFEVGRIVGRDGSNFIVQIGNERRVVPPTDIQRVLR